MEATLRPATPADAGDLARLVDMAGEGLPSHIWAGMAQPGEDPFAVGTARAARGEGAFSWRNATLAEGASRVAGALVGYPIARTEPLDELPPMFRPLQELENEAVGTWYVNVLATYPEWRGRGIASALMAEAEHHGSEMAGTSLIVADGNERACRFYRARGYLERGRRAIVKGDWHTESRSWLLLVRPPAG